jgi:hypothetical protein
MIQLGDRVRDRITGFEGIVIGITDWLYQCRRPIVQPSTLTSDGKPTESMSFDEDQLDVLEAGAFVIKRPDRAVTAEATAEVPVAVKTGGPRDTPTRRPDPRR